MRGPRVPGTTRSGQLSSEAEPGIEPRARHLPGVGFAVIFSRHYVFKQLPSSDSVKTDKGFMLKKKKKLGVHIFVPVFT